MITKDMDKKITTFTEERPQELKGRIIIMQLLSGERIVGELINHHPNIIVVKDLNDHYIIKDVHRATIKRMLILLDGGLDKNGQPKH